MNPQLKIAIWNANGLSQHCHEVQAFLADKRVDVMLISETHCTSRSYIKLPHYTTYITNHPAGTARGGTAIIIKNSIAHQEEEKYEEKFMQATTITVNDQKGSLKIAAVYCPPNTSLKEDQFKHFYGKLGQRFLAGGDYNAKHVQW